MEFRFWLMKFPNPRWVAMSQQKLQAMDLDVIVFSEIGMDFPTYALAHNRLARVQMMAWGHPTTSGISTGTMDYFITHAAAER